jgi:DtxR family Mn-dependent transcriptional regulator
MKGEYDVFKKISCTNKEMISKSLEQYLKTMYILKKQNGDIRVTDIANKMNCSKPSVNKALNNLKDNDLVAYETYGKIELTEQGENLAKKILEAYDIVYLFLKDVLNLDSEEAEKEAENLKLSISDDTINKLAKYVHKVLDLNDLDCDYDINKEKCRICARRTKKA